MVGPNEEIIIVNFEEPTLTNKKPRLTYTLAERISNQVFKLSFDNGNNKFLILSAQIQISPLSSPVTENVILDMASVVRTIGYSILFLVSFL